MTRLNHFSDEIFALVAHVRRSVVAVRGARGSGADVLIGNQLIVTAAHVVEGASRCQLAGERGYRAVMAERADCDLALIDGRCVDRLFLPFARRVRVGELAVAVGCAFDVEGLSTIGIVSGFASGFQVGDRLVSDAIKADVPTAQGSSGGALANTRGELIGIVVGGTKDGGLSVSIGANRVREFALGTQDVVKGMEELMPEASAGDEGTLQVVSLIETLSYSELKGMRATIERVMAARRTEALAAFERERAALVTEYDLDAAPAGVVHEQAVIPTPAAVRIKYRDPETGAHWSGRGKQPGWLKDNTSGHYF